jgi:hypothetical protein
LKIVAEGWESVLELFKVAVKLIPEALFRKVLLEIFLFTNFLSERMKNFVECY